MIFCFKLIRFKHGKFQYGAIQQWVDFRWIPELKHKLLRPLKQIFLTKSQNGSNKLHLQ